MAASSTPSSTPSSRQAILDAALTVLQRDGAAALTVRNVTAEAGCSTTGVYTHFGGKSGVVEALFVGGFESFDATLEPYYSAGDLRGSGFAYRRWALANATQYMVMFGRAVPDFEPSDAGRGRGLQSFYRLVSAIATAMGRPADDPEAADRAYHLFATVHGYVMLELAHMAGETEAESERLYARALDGLFAKRSR